MKLWRRLICALAAAMMCLSAVSALAAERYQVLMYGDKDEYVLRLQKELKARGFMTEEPTGYYGDATVAAVKKVQEKKGLTVDGIAGVATQKALFGKYYSEIPSSRVVVNTKAGSTSNSSSSSSSGSASSSSSSSSAKRYQVMMYGDKDEYVLRLQKELIARGYMSGKATGYYGDATEQAVTNFQKKKGLEADGIAGVATQKALFGKYYEAIPESRKVKGNTTTADTSTDEEDEKFDSMRKGDAGSVVKTVQEQLKKLGYFNQSKLTTYFGDVTEEAVLAFQKQNGLKEDGVVGIKTYTLLFSGKAKKAEPSSSSSTGGSGSTPAKQDEEVNLGVTGNSEVIEEAIRFAGEQLGKRYVYGGKGPNTFDCSGFTSYVLKHVGVTVSGSSKAQGNKSDWPKISYENLQRGDLLIFTGTKLKGIGHVGIYLGDGRFIHCSSGSAMSVTISHLADRYMDRFLWGRRWAVDADAKIAAEAEETIRKEEEQEGGAAAEIPDEDELPVEETVTPEEEQDLLIEDEE